MNKFKLLFLLAIAIVTNAVQAQSIYLDPSKPIDDRAKDLVSKLTLNEKIHQMMNVSPAIPRLNVPEYDWWNEALHGVARSGAATIFPQAIAFGATFDDKLIHKVSTAISDEARAMYNAAQADGYHGRFEGLTFWTPNINIFRDPRWGRGQETYGEDPYLTGTMGKSFVTGLQGNDPKYLMAAACAKHYAVHSGPEPSRHEFNTDISNYDLWDTYLPAFRNLVVNAKVAGVMCAYNAVKGQPCCGSDLLMTNILRNEWNFTGYVTSDCGAIDDFFQKHKTSPDAESAAADAVLHGTDVECGKTTYKSLAQAVKDGKLTEKDMDISLKRLFTIRFRLGMFDPADMVKYSQIGTNVLEAPEHKAQALKMARQSIVLLKNQNHTLPLTRNLKKVAIIGPNADNSLSILGNYNGRPTQSFTALQGIKAKLGPGTEVIYKKGIDYTGKLGDDKGLIDSVKDVDVIIYVGGISPQLEGEEMRVNREGFLGGDRTSILLPEIQTQLLKDLQATGKPVVFVMMTGSAIAIPWEDENIPAIVNAWYGGQDAGTALADVLFGDYNPAGRLPVTFYKSDSDLPSFTDYSMNNRTYRYFTGKPLYGFGFGLSYSNFKYEDLIVPAAIHAGKPVTVSVKVTNTGKMDGEEVSELYLSHLGLKIKTPIRALKGFERNFIKAGQSKIVHFQLTPEELSLTEENGHWTELHGKLMISVGGSQPDAQTVKTKKTIAKEVSII